MWLGKVVNSVDLGGACKKKHVGKAQHIKGIRYDGGDWRASPSYGTGAPGTTTSTWPFAPALIFQQYWAPPRDVGWRWRRSGGGAGAEKAPAAAGGNGGQWKGLVPVVSAG